MTVAQSGAPALKPQSVFVDAAHPERTSVGMAPVGAGTLEILSLAEPRTIKATLRGTWGRTPSSRMEVTAMQALLPAGKSAGSG